VADSSSQTGHRSTKTPRPHPTTAEVEEPTYQDVDTPFHRDVIL
jgi:hypothetical protein